MKTKVQVKDLRAGDDLGNCKIVADPTYYGDFCGQKDRMAVQVQRGETVKTSLWGKNTTVVVINRTQI